MTSGNQVAAYETVCTIGVLIDCATQSHAGSPVICPAFVACATLGWRRSTFEGIGTCCGTEKREIAESWMNDCGSRSRARSQIEEGHSGRCC